MRSSHSAARTRARFDDPNLVSHAGLGPLVRLMENIDLAGLADELVRLGGSPGANAGAKITTIVAGMCADADSIDDLDVLRHGAMGTLFQGIRAPSTLGTFLRWFSIGHVAQVEKLLSEVLARLAAQTPLLAGARELAFLDLDSKLTQVFGRTKQGARFGHQKIRGLDFLAATLSTRDRAPVIVHTRLRGGNADTRRKVTSFAQHAIRVTRACGAIKNLLVRGDSGYYVGELIAEIVRSGAWFSITMPQRKPIQAAITAIDDAAWTPLTHAHPVHDEDTTADTTTADIAETSYTAFTNPTTSPGQRTTGRLIVHRTPIPTHANQGQLITVYRYHAFFTNSPEDLITAHTQHHARAGSIEHVFADLNNSALAHFPSSHFAANAAWLTLAALAHNLTRAAGVLAGGTHTHARTTTLRHQLIRVAARISRTARTLTYHLPIHWPWHHTWHNLYTATHHPPPVTA
jgi:hypothetical protein